MESLHSDDIAYDGRTVSLTLGVASRGESVKTSIYRGVVIVRGAIADLVIALKHQTKGKFFQFASATIIRAWHQACATLGIDHTGPMHVVRHTAPNEDIAKGRITMVRGRWKTMDSVRRCSKTFALTKYRARVPEELIKKGTQIAADLRGCLIAALQRSRTKAPQEEALAKYLVAALKSVQRKDIDPENLTNNHQEDRVAPQPPTTQPPAPKKKGRPRQHCYVIGCGKETTRICHHCHVPSCADHVYRCTLCTGSYCFSCSPIHPLCNPATDNEALSADDDWWTE
jgi:hypothetical protein